MGLTLENAYARFRVSEKGIMTLIDLTEESFSALPHIELIEIGDLTFTRRGPGGTWADWVEIGPDGDALSSELLASRMSSRPLRISTHSTPFSLLGPQTRTT